MVCSDTIPAFFTEDRASDNRKIERAIEGSIQTVVRYLSDVSATPRTLLTVDNWEIEDAIVRILSRVNVSGEGNGGTKRLDSAVCGIKSPRAVRAAAALANHPRVFVSNVPVIYSGIHVELAESKVESSSQYEDTLLSALEHIAAVEESALYNRIVTYFDEVLAINELTLPGWKRFVEDMARLSNKDEGELPRSRALTWLIRALYWVESGEELPHLLQEFEETTKARLREEVLGKLSQSDFTDQDADHCITTLCELRFPASRTTAWAAQEKMAQALEDELLNGDLFWDEDLEKLVRGFDATGL